MTMYFIGWGLRIIQSILVFPVKNYQPANSLQSPVVHLNMYWMIREYIGFTSREKRSLLFILLIISGSLFYRIWLSSREPPAINLSEEQKKEIQAFIDSFEEKIPADDEKHGSNRETTDILPGYRLHKFDPNIAETQELLNLGLDEFVVKNIINYRKAGGVFKKTEDLSKIYGLDTSKYLELVPFVILPPENVISAKSIGKDTTAESELLTGYETRLNIARFRDIMQIEGMDPKIVGRMLNYRDLLGGFYSADQLDEVYGMTDSLKRKLIRHFRVDSENVYRFSFEELNFSDLLRHPYTEKEHVKEFFRLKEFYGDSLKLEHIKANRIFPDSIFLLIKPYFPE